MDTAVTELIVGVNRHRWSEGLGDVSQLSRKKGWLGSGGALLMCISSAADMCTTHVYMYVVCIFLIQSCWEMKSRCVTFH